MNIGIVSTWFERGAAYVSLQYANRLKEDGANVFIYARGGFDSDFNNNFKIEEDRGANLVVRGAINLVQFENWMKNNNLDYVLFNEQFWLAPVLKANELGIKTIAYIDYYTKDSIDLFNSYDLLLCNTKKHFSAFEKLGNAKYIPWGTDVNIFKHQVNKKSDVISFFHSAGWSPLRKGTDILIDAAFEIKEPFKLIIHAQSDLSELIPEKKQKIDSLISNNKLEIIIKTVGAPGLYHLGDVYVYPTRLEGIGLSIAEAMSCGLPVIVPDNGPMNEFIDTYSCKTIPIEKFENRSDNYYWPMSIVNSNELAAQMCYYISNLNKLDSYKDSARRHALKHLSWDLNTKDLTTVISRLEIKKIDLNLRDKINKNDLEIMKYGWLYKLTPTIYRILVGIYKNQLKLR